ncbi:MAG: hypothetical protein EOP48_26570 [Sphingobacteriales bacterium]|nr:MAG: hypothetical protein EOP48_26570 [Sphingobacteriales bacterium]
MENKEVLGKKERVRWAVGAIDSKRSSTWAMWGDKKGELYLSARSVGGQFKLSFHKSRICTLGCTREYAISQNIDPKARSLHRWKLPDQETVLAVQIIIPENELIVFKEEKLAKTRWIMSPPEGEVITCSMFISEKSNSVGVGAFAGELVGSIETNDRSSWVQYTRGKIPATHANWIAREKALALCNSPPVIANTMGNPYPSTARWILLVLLPRLKPIAS